MQPAARDAAATAAVLKTRFRRMWGHRQFGGYQKKTLSTRTHSKRMHGRSERTHTQTHASTHTQRHRTHTHTHIRANTCEHAISRYRHMGGRTNGINYFGSYTVLAFKPPAVNVACNAEPDGGPRTQPQPPCISRSGELRSRASAERSAAADPAAAAPDRRTGAALAVHAATGNHAAAGPTDKAAAIASDGAVGSGRDAYGIGAVGSGCIARRGTWASIGIDAGCGCIARRGTWASIGIDAGCGCIARAQL